MQIYSPFQTSFDDIEAHHLGVLRTVSEGWYVEYKREVPSASSIAKSISAFANTYGGWLFYGIEEQSKADNVAGTFTGIPSGDIDGSLQRIQQAISVQLQPSPYYEARVLYGPDGNTGLAAGKAIICIRVMQGKDAPYVHKDGRIYRRVADGSDPKSETDRFLLGELWKRRDSVVERYREWVVHQDPEFSTAEEEMPYLRVMLVADLWRDRDLWHDFSVEEIRSIFIGTPPGVSSVPFENIHTSADGFVCRQMRGMNPAELGLVWKVRPDLRSDILLPLTLIERDIDELELALAGYEQAGRFVRLLRQYRYEEPRIIDLNLLFGLLLGIARIHLELYERAAWRGQTYMKFKLLNSWRTVPFVDLDSIVEHEERHGLAMNLDSSVLILPGHHPDSFAEMEFPDDLGGLTREFLYAARMFSIVARGFGLPEFLTYEDASYAGRHFYSDLITAAQRAARRQNSAP